MIRTVRHSPRRAFSMVEMIIAVAIALAFVSGVVAVYIQVARTHDATERRMEAIRSGRTALMTIGREIKAAGRNFDPAIHDLVMVGLDFTVNFGNNIDDDGDSQIDEEIVDGLNNDGGTTLTLSSEDRHAVIGGFFERPLYVGRFDLGDADVDEDVRFGRDTLIFNAFPDAPTPGLSYKTISYFISDFEGRPAVLMRQVVNHMTNGDELPSIAPLAFNVVGFDVLYWNPNEPPGEQYWTTRWESDSHNPGDPDSPLGSSVQPPLPLPASVYVRLTLLADEADLAKVGSDQPFETVTLETMVNIEETIGHARYPRPTL